MRPTVGRPPSTSRGASKGTELSIIAARKRERQARRPAGRSTRSSAHVFVAEHLLVGLIAAIVLSARCCPAAVPASGDGWPCRPCARPREPLRSSTRARCPSGAPPCRPCSQSRAACFAPSTQIRDLLLPRLPPDRDIRPAPVDCVTPRCTLRSAFKHWAATDVPRESVTTRNHMQLKVLRKRFSVVESTTAGKECSLRCEGPANQQVVRKRSEDASQAGIVEASRAAAPSRSRTRIRPSSASTSKSPGLTAFPVTATREA